MILHRAIWHAMRYGSIPAYEFTKAHVLKKGRVTVRPFDKKRGFIGDPAYSSSPGRQPRILNLNVLRLAHAMKKAELARSVFSPFYVTLMTLGFLFEYGPVFRWKSGNLRYHPNFHDWYNDSSRTALATKVGEGLAHLLMQDMGYEFWDHVERHLKTPTSGGQAKERADFIFEDNSRDFSLAEAKGRFANQEHTAIRADLRKALSQLKATIPQITVPVQKTFAIASYLRSATDPGGEPSLMAWVDPEEERTNRKDHKPLDIRAGNYGSWLMGMGFIEAGVNLRTGSRSDTTEVVLQTIEVAEQSFAVSPYPMLSFAISPVGPYYNLTAGLEVGVLKKVSRAVTEGTWEPLVSIDRGDSKSGLDTELESIPASVFRDGTLLMLTEVNQRVETEPIVVRL